MHNTRGREQAGQASEGVPSGDRAVGRDDEGFGVPNKLAQSSNKSEAAPADQGTTTLPGW